MLVIKSHALFIPRFFSFALIAAAAVSFNLPAAYSAPLGRGYGGHGPGKEFPFGESGKASEADRTVGVFVDGMKYVLSATEFEAGETVRFVIVNSSSIAHDFTLGDAGTQKAHRREMEKMMTGDAMPDHMKHDDANAVFLKQGEAKEIIWKFSRPGMVLFACNIPGHYEAGMHGNIRVTG